MKAHHLYQKIYLNQTNTKMINVLLCQILAYFVHENYKKFIQTINLKYLLRQGTKDLANLMDHILFLIFKIIFSISSRNMKQVADNLQ